MGEEDGFIACGFKALKLEERLLFVASATREKRARGQGFRFKHLESGGIGEISDLSIGHVFK
jgi:hypothetical protein